ncbi:VOC family protein, partial [Methylobacterium soli]
LSVAQPERTEAVLTEVLGMRHDRSFLLPEGEVRVFSMGTGGPAAELQLLADRSAPARQGAGAVHHVAFRIPDADYGAWADRLKARRMPSSGPIDRYYFRSLYFREPNGILFEIATDGPGFTADEPLEALGERLALPPFLEPRRAEIEAGLKPL